MGPWVGLVIRGRQVFHKARVTHKLVKGSAALKTPTGQAWPQLEPLGTSWPF